MGNLKIKDLRAYLKEKDENELRQEIVEIVKEFKEVKIYYYLKLNPGEEENELEKFKKKIKNEFFPSRGFGKVRYEKIDEAIRTFIKMAINKESIIDLILTFVENATAFIDEYGDIEDQYYEEIYDYYQKAIEMIADEDLREKFHKRIKWIYDNTTEGYGFKDEMAELYYDYYGGEEF